MINTPSFNEKHKEVQKLQTTKQLYANRLTTCESSDETQRIIDLIADVERRINELL